MIVTLTDERLIERLQDLADTQHVTVDALVQTTLQKCDELNLLANVMGRDVFDERLRDGEPG